MPEQEQQKSSPILVAVYGSLLSDMGNHRVMGRADGKLLGTDVLPKNYTMTSNGAFPYLYPEGSDPVHVEVYEVPESGLTGPLDSLEGYSASNPAHSFYVRHLVDTKYGQAWIYFHNSPLKSDTRAVVPNGDWKSYKNN